MIEGSFLPPPETSSVVGLISLLLSVFEARINPVTLEVSQTLVCTTSPRTFVRTTHHLHGVREAAVCRFIFHQKIVTHPSSCSDIAIHSSPIIFSPSATEQCVSQFLPSNFAELMTGEFLAGASQARASCPRPS